MNEEPSTSINSVKPLACNRQFICIDYPGLVENDSEAIRTLGGMNRIEQTFQRPSRKLFLNYNPDNIFSKMLCSAQIETSPHLLLNSKTTNGANTPKSGQDETNASNDPTDPPVTPKSTHLSDLVSMPCFLITIKKKTLQAELAGRVDRIYTFKKIADFQYLPMSSNSLSKSQSNKQTNSFQFNAFYDNFRFNLIDNYDHDLRKNNIPNLFVLPPFFSRFDDPVNYAYRSEPIKRDHKTALNTLLDIDETTENQANASKSDELIADEESNFLHGDKQSSQKEEYSSSSGLIR
jgi:hypothetical protein